MYLAQAKPGDGLDILAGAATPRGLPGALASAATPRGPRIVVQIKPARPGASWRTCGVLAPVVPELARAFALAPVPRAADRLAALSEGFDE